MVNIKRVKEKHWWMYVLALEDDCYYVGITSLTPEKRFKQHLKGFAGASWTRKHRPVKIVDSVDLSFKTLEEAQDYENKVLRRYIKEFGIDHVRGGDISTTESLLFRFGFYMDAENLFSITIVLILLLIITILLYLK